MYQMVQAVPWAVPYILALWGGKGAGGDASATRGASMQIHTGTVAFGWVIKQLMEGNEATQVLPCNEPLLPPQTPSPSDLLAHGPCRVAPPLALPEALNGVKIEKHKKHILKHSHDSLGVLQGSPVLMVSYEGTRADESAANWFC